MLKYITSIFLFVSTIAFAQETDSIPKVKTPHSIRVGLDISKPIISLLDADISGFELVADYKISKNLFAAIELGNSKRTDTEDYLNYTASGSYGKIGVNYNVYENWLDMNNEIYFGFRYGYSAFSQTLNSYTINQFGTYYTNPSISAGTKFSSLNASWIELQMGLKVEVFKNLFLGTSLQLKKIISSKEPENFKNLNIPGFNRVFSNNAGVGFNYTVMYNIPLF